MGHADDRRHGRRAPTRASRARRGVRVGIIDTGIDASHPDIAPNFDARLSRNFTVDDPVDRRRRATPTRTSPARTPPNVDEDGHGTHVASTIGSPLNGIGIAGVAPKVELVNLRAGQDSGYFFLGPTLDALTYAGDHGIDVVNMSYYIDPWLYNCTANPADSPAEQREQRLVIEATQRAHRLRARPRRHDDRRRGQRPHGPRQAGVRRQLARLPGRCRRRPADARERTIDNSCRSMPTEADGVIGVTSVGPSKRKAYYSDYGLEQADVAAPGGDTPRHPGTAAPDRERDPRRLPGGRRRRGRRRSTRRPASRPRPLVIKQGGAYYQYIQGTSMASPHAVGVAALIVAEYGQRDRRHGGLTLSPDRVERILKRTATDTPARRRARSPTPDPDPGAEIHGDLRGLAAFNGFYGDGIVNALAAVSRGGR